MATEIVHIDRSSAFRIAFALGLVNGLILALPIIWNWIDTGQWVTGYQMGPGAFVFGVLISVVAAAITTAVLAWVFVIAYNVVARRFGGVSMTLSRQ